MKKIITAIIVCTVLCAAVFAQNESDFKTDGKGTITKYEGWDTTIVIPVQINGVPVTAIGNGVFKNMGITSITLPTGIKLIGSEAFKGNKLTNISIPNGVTVDTSSFSENQLTSVTIGDEAYIKNSAFTKNQLTSVVIGKKVRIEGFAFSNNKLTRVSIGDNSIIRGNAFSENPSLISINLGSNIYMDMDSIGDFAFYEYMCNNRKTGTYNNPKINDIPEKKEGDYSFFQTRYGSVISDYRGNEGARLIIPQQLGGMPVKGIDSTILDKRENRIPIMGTPANYFGAFAGRRISRCQLPNGLTFICSAFKNNELTSINIPESVIYIGHEAFRQNRLTDITIPDNVICIGNSAFMQNDLSSVTIGKSILFIGNNAFSGDTNFIGDSGIKTNHISSVTIGNSVISIGSEAFYKNSLKSFNIPDSVTYIGEKAFANNGLTSITISNNITYIPASAFADNKLTSITIPDKVTFIDLLAFEHNNLTNITIGANVTVNNYAFSSYESAFVKLYNINRSAGTYTLNNKEWRFSPITDLSTSSDFVIENGILKSFKGNGGNIIIDNTVTSIGKEAFKKCTSITGITIGSGVTSIGASAFEGCTKLTTINVDIGNTAYISDNGVLYNKDKTTLIQYPAGKTGTMFTVPDSVTSIEYGAFSSCTNLTNITIPFVGGKLNNRGTYTTHFGYIFGAPTDGLQGSIIPTSIKTVIITGGNSIEDYAFRDCFSLTNVTIPDSVKSIGESAFTRCENLKNIIIGNNVTSIGNYAFNECKNLIDVTIGSGVTSIGRFAFFGCNNLKSVTFQGIIFENNLSTIAFEGLGDLRTKYLNRGIGTYTRNNGESKTWTKK
jgi:hypothetical protein